VVHPFLRAPRPVACWEGSEEVVLLVLHSVTESSQQTEIWICVLCTQRALVSEHCGILMPSLRVALSKVCHQGYPCTTLVSRVQVCSSEWVVMLGGLPRAATCQDP
jgi:hypothetical protein